MGKSKDYQKASDSYDNSIKTYTTASNQIYNSSYKNSKKYTDEYNKKAQEAYNRAYNNSEQYVGDKGYNRALELGKKGATSASNASIAQGISSARASGMNKAQASAMGNQSAINTYGNQLGQQQQSAYNSGIDAVNRENTYAGNIANTAQNVASMKSDNEYNYANGMNSTLANYANLRSQKVAQEQAEANNKYNRTWGIIGGINSLLTSDERLKNYKDISEKFCNKSNDDSESIMKYKINIEKYKGE